jgi:hypothetical protein
VTRTASPGGRRRLGAQRRGTVEQAGHTVARQRDFLTASPPQRDPLQWGRPPIATYVDEHFDVPSETWDVADTLLLMDATTGWPCPPGWCRCVSPTTPSALDGQHVVQATPAGSGKSLGFLAPVFDGILRCPRHRRCCSTPRPRWSRTSSWRCAPEVPKRSRCHRGAFRPEARRRAGRDGTYRAPRWAGGRGRPLPAPRRRPARPRDPGLPARGAASLRPSHLRRRDQLGAFLPRVALRRARRAPPVRRLLRLGGGDGPLPTAPHGPVSRREAPQFLAASATIGNPSEPHRRRPVHHNRPRRFPTGSADAPGRRAWAGWSRRDDGGRRGRRCRTRPPPTPGTSGGDRVRNPSGAWCSPPHEPPSIASPSGCDVRSPERAGEMHPRSSPPTERLSTRTLGRRPMPTSARCDSRSPRLGGSRLTSDTDGR